MPLDRRQISLVALPDLILSVALASDLWRSEASSARAMIFSPRETKWAWLVLKSLASTKGDVDEERSDRIEAGTMSQARLTERSYSDLIVAGQRMGFPSGGV